MKHLEDELIALLNMKIGEIKGYAECMGEPNAYLEGKKCAYQEILMMVNHFITINTKK